MRTLAGGYKQYMKSSPGEVMAFLKDEKERVPRTELGDFESLTPFDMNQQLCFKIMLDNRIVGFACAKWNNDPSSRRLTRIYITPHARKRGCASFIIRGLRIAQISIPVANAGFIGLCRTLGFQYNARQNYPSSLAELSRTVTEVSACPPRSSSSA